MVSICGHREHQVRRTARRLLTVGDYAPPFRLSPFERHHSQWARRVEQRAVQIGLQAFRLVPAQGLVPMCLQQAIEGKGAGL